MHYYVSCKNKKGEYEHFAVPEEIATYILQLEAYIHYPHLSKLKEVYSEKFSNSDIRPMEETKD